MNIIAVKISTKHDFNGNPRRGWLIYNDTGAYLGFVDEGYSGCGALDKVYNERWKSSDSQLMELCTVYTIVSYYNFCKKNEIW